MLRTEIALFLVLAFVAFLYFSAEKEHSTLHKTFSVLLVTILDHLLLDGTTVYTVNHLDKVPPTLNEIIHRVFIGSMVVCYAAVAVYLVMCAVLLIQNWKKIGDKRKTAIGIALIIEFTGCVLQGFHPDRLILPIGKTKQQVK